MFCRTTIFAILIFSFSTNFAFAACIADKSTVVYINGINTTEQKAREDLRKLQTEYIGRGNKGVIFLNGYNASHFEVAGDLIKTFMQNRSTPGTYVEDYDLRTILLNLHGDLTTRRVVLVGHSQGSYYTNAVYNYLLSHGTPREAVGVYNVATPASFVEGGGNGKYLNSSGDALLVWVKDKWGFSPLKNNISLVATDTGQEYPGHSFSGQYLAQAPQHVVGDIHSLVGKLEPAFASDKGECFTPPTDDLWHKGAGVALVVGDVAAGVAKSGLGAGAVAVKAAGTALAAVAEASKKVAKDVGVAWGGAKGLGNAANGSIDSRERNFKILNALYGSSLNSEDLRELLGSGGGGAVVAAPVLVAPQAGEVLGAGAPAPKPAPTRRYVTRASGTGDEPEPAQEPAQEEVAQDVPIVEEEPAEDEVASTTEEVPPEEPPAEPAFVGGFGVEDGFDAGVSGWTPFGMSGVLPVATSTNCLAGACITGDTQNPNVARMYKIGPPQASGAFTVYVRLRAGSFTPFFNPTPQVHLCYEPGTCEDGSRSVALQHTLLDDTWHQYLVAWRQGATSVEVCSLLDTTDMSGCVWRETNGPLGAQVNGVVLMSGHGYRPDLGGEFWFDELASHTP